MPMWDLQSSLHQLSGVPVVWKNSSSPLCRRNTFQLLPLNLSWPTLSEKTPNNFHPSFGTLNWLHFFKKSFDALSIDENFCHDTEQNGPSPILHIRGKGLHHQQLCYITAKLSNTGFPFRSFCLTFNYPNMLSTVVHFWEARMFINLILKIRKKDGAHSIMIWCYNIGKNVTLVLWF